MQGVIVSVDQVRKALAADSPPRLFDTRFNLGDIFWGEQEYAESHISGALYAHLDRDLSSPVIPGQTGRHPLPDKAAFIDFLERSGITANDDIVIYDQGPGYIAARMWWLLRWLGHSEVSILDGGWEAWLSENGATESAQQLYSRSTYKALPQPHLAVERTEIAEMAGKLTLIDSRDARRYHGIEEPIDPVAGHIPGAVNLPFRDNMNKDGRWKSRAELRERFHDLRENVVFYCGSGVTACHNILAYEYAGLGKARLYAGSWSEWITDPDAPIVTSDQ